MSSLRAAVTAAALGSKSWSLISSPALRNARVCALKRAVSSSDANFSNTCCCQLSHKDDNEEHANADGGSDKGIDVSGSQSATSSKIQPSQSDSFQEIISASRRIFSPSFRRDCQYRLITWHKMIKDMENKGKPVNLEEILSDSFPDVVEFSLTPLAIPEVRLSVLKILLTQPQDDGHADRILCSMSADVMLLPIGVVAEVVRVLALAPPTKLRDETRRLMVSEVVNRRWYEVGAKHLVFFMFQLDELFPVKAISQQLRQRSRSKELKEAKTKRRKDNTNNQNSSTSKETFSKNLVSSENLKKDIEGGTGDTTDPAFEGSEDTENQQKVDEKEDKALPSVTCMNLESRAITLADELKVKDLARVVSLLSRWGSRNEPLLNACLHRLSMADLSTFTPTQLGSLLQAMASLSLHHTALLENLTKELSRTLMGSAPSTSNVCAILTSLSVLRWTGERNGGGSGQTGLVPLCLSYLGNRVDKLTVKEAAVTLTSLTSLSAVPSDNTEQKIVKDLASLLLDGKSPWWSQVHCAWCLSVLNCLDSDVAQKVLDPQFVEQVLQKVKESASSSSALASAAKLAQVNMAASLEIKGYDGPVLSEEQLNLCMQQVSPSPDQKKARTALTNTLRKFVDLMTYVDLNPALPKGASADALMCANYEGDVRPLAAAGGQVGGDGANTTERVHRLAVQYIPFSGVNGPGVVPTGLYLLAARHLSLLGYTPVQILYSDLKPSMSILEKVTNVKTRIKSAVLGTTPSTASTCSASSLSGHTPSAPTVSSASATTSDDTGHTSKPS